MKLAIAYNQHGLAHNKKGEKGKAEADWQKAKEPVHIHVESDDKYAKFWMEPVHLAKSAGYCVKELREFRNLIMENAEIFKRS